MGCSFQREYNLALSINYTPLHDQGRFSRLSLFGFLIQREWHFLPGRWWLRGRPLRTAYAGFFGGHSPGATKYPQAPAQTEACPRLSLFGFLIQREWHFLP